MIKKFAGFVLTLAMFLGLGIPALATNVNINEPEIKVAYIPDIDETGSNIGTDLTNATAIISDFEVQVISNGQSVQLVGEVQEASFNVHGSVLTTNENGNVIIYDTRDEEKNFEIAYCAIERDIKNASYFFKGYYESTLEAQNIIKLYLQPSGMNSLVLIEVFLKEDVVTHLLQNTNVPYDSRMANLNQAWFAKYYGPVIDYAELDTPQPVANTSSVTRDYSKSYLVFGEYVRYFFKVSFNCTFPDIIKNGGGQAKVYAYVIESRTESRDNPSSSLNSSKQDVLSIESLNVKYKSAPYIILTAEAPIRDLKAGVLGAVDGSVSFGFSYGLVSVAGSYTFNRSDVISTAKVMLPKTSTEGVTASESGTMPSQTCMINKGNQYGVEFDFQDVGNTSRSGTVGVSMDFRVVNSLHPSETKWDSYSNTYDIRVR